MFDGQSVYLLLPCGTTLAARYLGSGSGVDIPNGSRGVVRGILDTFNRSDTLAAVKFFNYKTELVIPTKYLRAA
jgi:hypothetical protein